MDSDDEGLTPSSLTRQQWAKLLYVFPYQRERNSFDASRGVVPIEKRKQIIREIENIRKSGRVTDEVAGRFRTVCTPRFVNDLGLKHLIYPEGNCGNSDTSSDWGSGTGNDNVSDAESDNSIATGSFTAAVDSSNAGDTSSDAADVVFDTAGGT